MCVMLMVNGKECDCIKDLRDLGMAIVPLNGREPDDYFEDGECLCSVNVERTAAENQMSCKRIHSMEYKLESEASDGQT